MASCKSILDKLIRDKRITQEEYDKLLRNIQKPMLFKIETIDGKEHITPVFQDDKYKKAWEALKTAVTIETGVFTLLADTFGEATNRKGYVEALTKILHAMKQAEKEMGVEDDDSDM